MTRLRSVILNGLPWGIYFFALSYFAGTVASRISSRQLFIFSSVTALLAILANGLVYRRFRTPVTQLAKLTVEVDEGEAVVFESTAGYRIDDELILGKLLITDRRLSFQATDFAAKPMARYSWNLREITVNKFYPSFWNAGGVFSVEDVNGNIHFFDVSRLKEFRRILGQNVKNA